MPYRGYGRPDRIHLIGRVLRDKTIIRQENDTFWRNFVNNFKRFNSREINDAVLKIQIADHQFFSLTDQEGYFRLEAALHPPLQLPSDPVLSWLTAQIKVLSIPGKEVNVYQEGQILIPHHADFGVISDIDDTVLKTDVTSLLKLRTLYLTLLKNAGTRIAFRQVSAFFRALCLGPQNTSNNPFFYVSNSPWNLYDLLDEFLELNELPSGPILLRDFGLPYQEFPADYRGHKYEQIATILRTYDEWPFVLVGDSGEKDTDIYLSIAREFPERICAIFIRDVLSIRRAQRVRSLIQQASGTPVFLVRNYGEAAEHAAELGLLDQGTFDELAPKLFQHL